jgi:gliding motility-associated-like protein
MVKQPIIISYTKLTILFLFVLGTLQIHSQCPSIININQSFCDLEGPTISDLVATDNGSGIFWYDTETSTTPIGNSEGLISGEDYYADDNTGTCGTRERVDVFVYGEPLGLNFQGVCVDDLNDATISDLNAIGNNVQWYTVPSEGSSLSPTTILNDNTIYYADQENPDTNCRTSRLSVLVNIGFVPVPTANPIQEFCSDQQPTVADLVAEGSNNWYANQSSVIPLDLNEVLIDGENYFATSVDPPCESDNRLEVTVVINSPANSGVNGILEICETELTTTTSVNLIDGLSGSPDTNGSWTGPFPTTNGSIGTVDITSMTVTGGPYVFTYLVDSETICGTNTSTVSILIIPPPNAGTDAALDLCENDAPIDLFTILGGAPETGGTWSPTLTSGTGLFDPSQDIAGVYTYTVTGTPPCDDTSASVTVTTNTPLNAGTNNSVDLCTNNDPIDLFTILGGTPETGGTWSPTLTSGTGLFDPTVDSEGVYTYTLIGTPPCDDASATVTVTFVPTPNAGEESNAIICSDDGTQDLFNYLGGTPDLGGTWSPTTASGTGIFDPNLDIAGIYTYTVTGPIACNQTDTSAVSVTIEINPNTTGLEISSEDICLGLSIDISISNATLLPDGSFILTYNLSGANQSDNAITINITNGISIFNISANLLTTPGLTTVTIASIISIDSICSADVSAITTSDFIIFDSVTPQIIQNGNIFCTQDEPTIENLSNNITSTDDITWFDAPINGNSYSNIDTLVDGETYYASALTDNGCESINRLEITVLLEDCPEEIVIPDGFSPNNDSINDEFTIENLRDLYPGFTLEIYNRYGNILYKGDINTSDWDGTSKKGLTLGESLLPVGVYFFVLEFNDENNKNPIQGRVYLSR